MSNTMLNTKEAIKELFQKKEAGLFNLSDKEMVSLLKAEFGINFEDSRYEPIKANGTNADRLFNILMNEFGQNAGKILVKLSKGIDDKQIYNFERTAKDDSMKIQKFFLEVFNVGMNLMLSEPLTVISPRVRTSINKARIIKEFNAFNPSQLSEGRKISLLRLLFWNYESTIKAIRGKGVFVLSDGLNDLNDYFKVLKRKFVELVDSEFEFLDIKVSDAYEHVVKRLSQDVYDFSTIPDDIWDNGVKRLLITLGEQIAEMDLFVNNAEVYPFESGVANFLKAVEEEISRVTESLRIDEAKHFEAEKLKSEESAKGSYYITKDGDDFKYKGKILNLSRGAQPYKVFCLLYAKVPHGGEVKYQDLIDDVKRLSPEFKSKQKSELIKIMQRNLTDANNGFLHSVGIANMQDNGKPLIQAIHSTGFRFNNGIG